MKKYVIICETMYRADQLFSRTAIALTPMFNNIHKHPILNIETCDGRSLYFVSEDYWFGRGGRLGRYDWKPISERNFEDALDYFVENKESFVEYGI